MRRKLWLPIVLASLLGACQPPQTASIPKADPNPSPSADPVPEATSKVLDITVRELTLDETGTLRLEIDAPEALVLLPLVEPQNYFLRMDDAPASESLAYRALARRSLAPALRFQAASPRPRALPAASGYGDKILLNLPQGPANVNKAYDGAHCLIYVDPQGASPSQAQIQQLGKAFDEQLYPKVKETLGQEPGGRPTEPVAPEHDGFNRGDDRFVLVLSQQFQDEAATSRIDDTFPPTALESMVLWEDSNFGKFLYLDPTASVSQILPTLASELGRAVFFLQRLEHYSALKGEGLPAGQSLAYLLDEEGWEDYWLSAAMGQFAKVACGYTPDAGDRDALVAVSRFLDVPSQYRLDMFPDDEGHPNNDGQLLLFTSYLQGLKPGFAKNLATSSKFGTAAISDVMGKDFSALFRDFSLATVLDGLKGVPATYDIPHVNLHKTYTIGNERYPFAGAGASMTGVAMGQGALQTIMLRGRFPQTPTRLALSAGKARKASLVIFRPSESARFSEE